MTDAERRPRADDRMVAVPVGYPERAARILRRAMATTPEGT